MAGSNAGQEVVSAGRATALLESPAVVDAREAGGETAGAQHSVRASGRKSTMSECFALKPGPYVLDPTAVKD
jgi:hypothetical protein